MNKISAPFWKWQNFAVFSDDAGGKWKYGGDVPGALLPDAKLGERSQVNEVQMVEMNDGSVRLDSRQFAGAKLQHSTVVQAPRMVFFLSTSREAQS